MGVFAIRKTAWNNGNASQKTAMRLAGERVELGVPAQYKAGTVVYFVSSDERFTLMDAAILGTVAAGLASYPNWIVPTIGIVDDDGNTIDTGRIDRRAARVEIAGFVRNNIVKPEDVPLTEIVQQTVPQRIQVEVPILDENGDPTGDTVTVWQDHPTNTVQIDVEQSLGDPFTLVLAAQGAPGWLKAASSLPDGWEPVEAVA